MGGPVGEVLGAWIRQDAKAAVAWMAAQDLDLFFAGWLGRLPEVERDPRPLLEALCASPGFPRQAQAVGWLINSWVGRDPAAAVAWVDALPAGPERTAFLLRAISTNAPGEVLLPLVLRLPEGEGRDGALRDKLAEWAARYSQAALAWIAARADDDPAIAQAAAGAHAGLLGSIARDEPLTAVAEWERLPDGRARQMGVAQIATAWGARDPVATARWLGEVGAKDEWLVAGWAANPFSEAVFRWAQQDPAAAVRWAESLPPGSDARPESLRLQMQALTAFAGSFTQRAGREALADTYVRLTNAELRAKFLGGVVRDWRAANPDAARAWVEAQASLGAEEKQRLLATAPATGGP